MKFSTIYSNTVSISALLVALTFSSNAHAGYSSCTELSAPKNADSIFRSTGVPEQYAEDILHSSFRSNIEEIAKKESKDTVRVLQTDAASGEILTSLWTFFSRKGKNFIGIGVNEPGSRPPLSSNRVDLLRQRRIKIVEENLSYTHVGERQSRIATPLMFSALKNKHDLVIDCLGEFDNTKHVTGIVENSLNLLKIGGSYYLTIPWKYL
nr:hypothetical protein [Methyloceanibacter sp.]